jgi:hypothetical protein
LQAGWEKSQVRLSHESVRFKRVGRLKDAKERKIVIYGVGKKSFSKSSDLQKYIRHDIFDMDRGRFGYPQSKTADAIVLSLDGRAYGHFDICKKVQPTNQERRKYPKVKSIYLVKQSTLYSSPVELLALDIKGIQFGRTLSEQQFNQIQLLAGETFKFEPMRIPEELPIGTYAEGAVLNIRINAYERSAAARQACIAHFGTRCQACALDLGERYGKIGKGVIHVHHIKLLSKIGESYQVNPLLDLRPVCPNCHVILHLTIPPMSIEALRLLISRSAEPT